MRGEVVVLRARAPDERAVHMLFSFKMIFLYIHTHRICTMAVGSKN